VPTADVGIRVARQLGGRCRTEIGAYITMQPCFCNALRSVFGLSQFCIWGKGFYVIRVFKQYE